MNINLHKPIILFLISCVIWWVAGSVGYIGFGELFLFKAINSFHNEFLDFVAWYGTQLGETHVMVATLIVVILRNKPYRNFRFISMVVLTLAIPALIIQGLKQIADAPRPLSLYADEPWIHYLPYYANNFWNSIPSGHTSGAFSFAVLLTSLLANNHKYWAILFFTIALFCGWTRIYLAQHFFIDVLIGSMIGTVLTLLIIMTFVKLFKVKL